MKRVFVISWFVCKGRLFYQFFTFSGDVGGDVHVGFAADGGGDVAGGPHTHVSETIKKTQLLLKTHLAFFS